MQPPHDHERAEQLLSEALSLPGPERIGFLSEACHDDIELRTELLSLLEHAEPAEKLFDTLADLAIPELPPPVVQAGRFEIMECIGVGGMGAVYRARDARLERDVALKFVPGLGGDQSQRIRDAARSGAVGPILDVEDPDGEGGVLISVE